MVQGQGGAEFQPAGILKYVEDLKRGPNAEIGPKDIFEIASWRQMVIFENPNAFLILLFLPLLLVGMGLFGWMTKKEIAEMFRLNHRHLKRSQIKKYTLAGIVMALLVAALALPKIPVSSFGMPKRTGEIALLVDVSASMGAQKDLYSPNRLERVKQILYEIIDSMKELGEVKISLHGFTCVARSHVPFAGKQDYPYLKESIKKVLGINSTPGEGSGFGRPVLNVAGKFSKDEKFKLVILLGDGNIFITLPGGVHQTERVYIERAIKQATKHGIKVITVGIGEKEGAKIPLRNVKGGFTGEYAKIRGVDYISYLEEESLKEIAFRTEGKYFFEKNIEGLIEFIKENLTLSSRDEVTEEVKDYRPIDHWFLLGSLPFWIIFARRYL